MRAALCTLLALCLCLCLSLRALPAAALSTSMSVQVVGSQILFFIKGVMYSPSPMGSHPAWTWPHGDFFIPQYQNLWQRDFPLLQALGANTIRISGWNNELDHGYFLDEAHKAGLKVIVTFNLGNVWQSPVGEDWQQQQHLGAFTWQVQRYLNHPALLAWSFGEQLNLPAQGYLESFASKHQCGWNGGDYNQDQGGCFNNPDPQHACAASISCVYRNFFGYLNQAASYAKNAMAARPNGRNGPGQAHLIIASLSDVDVAWMRMNQFGFAASAVDAWGLQIYRGRDFGQGKEDFLTLYEVATPYDAQGQAIESVKPLIVVEYGIDAYNDPCGKGYDTPCYNDVLDSPHGGFGEDEDSQADWGLSLASTLSAHSSAHGRGAVAGGTINSYIDEAWKCTTGVGGCGGPVPYPLPGFDASQCSWKAHVSCPEMNLWKKSLCGYWTPATFDHYSNQGWYGLLRPRAVWGDIDVLTPRLIFGKLQQHWGSLPRSGRVTSEWPWMVLLLSSLLVAGLLTYYVQREHGKRSAQVADLEAKSEAILSSSSGNTVTSRSPLLGRRQSSGGMGSPGGGRSSRSIPAGRSSRATATSASGGISSRSPDVSQLGAGSGSSSASPLLVPSDPSQQQGGYGGRSAASEEAKRAAQR